VRFVADECFPKAAVDALRERGHDVLWVRTASPGIPDTAVLSLAGAERRVVLTFDKDFGELAFSSGLDVSTGVVLFRLPLRSPGFVAQRAVAVIDAREDWRGHFSVVQEHRLRMVPLPSARGDAR